MESYLVQYGMTETEVDDVKAEYNAWLDETTSTMPDASQPVVAPE